MPEMASLMTITRSSFREFRKHRALWWFAVPIGILTGVSSFISIGIQDHIPKTEDLASLTSLLTNGRLILTLGVSLLVVLCQSTLRGILLGLYAHRINTSDTTKHTLFPWQDMLRAGRVSLTFEGAYWLLLISIASAVALPTFLAHRFNPSIMPVIFELAFLLLLTLGVYLYFIKELSCLYAIFGKTHFRSAGDLGFRLFRRNSFNTVLFFFYAALLALIYSLLIEYFFRLIHAPINQHSFLSSLFMALPFGLYYIFDQVLRASYFRSIATTPKKPIIKEPVLEASQSPSGISSS